MRTGTGLRSGALGLPNVIVQGITHIGPAIGMVLFIPVVASYAGRATPFAYLAATVMMLLVAIVLTQLARHLPSAGGYYTYLSRTVHPRVGFMTGWTMFIFELCIPASAFAYGGYIVQQTLKASYGFSFPWWAFFLLGTAGLFAVSYFGVQVSVRAAALFCGLEMAIVLAVAIGGLASPGPGGVGVAPFSPGSAPSGNGLYLGIVFTILAAAGFESTVPLAEETADPRRNVPRAMLLSVGLACAFYLFTAWGIITGWGMARLGTFPTAAENPVFLLARHLWGGAWIIVFIAVVNGIVGISIAAQNAATRVLFRMGRTGVLPAALGSVHPRHKTPVGAIVVQTLVTLGLGLSLGLTIGPHNVWVTVGLAGTIGYILMYIAGNAGAVRLYLGERRSEFRPVLHVVLPLVTSAGLVWVGYKSVVPLPGPPARYSPVAVVIWLVLGAVILVVVHQRGRERWLLEAGAEIESAAGPG